MNEPISPKAHHSELHKSREDQASINQDDANLIAKKYFIHLIIKIGWIALCISGIFLAISAYAFQTTRLGNGNWLFALSMVAARTSGIASFLCGTALILLERWTIGTVLFISSTVLPCISFIVSGTI